LKVASVVFENFISKLKSAFDNGSGRGRWRFRCTEKIAD